MRSHLPRCPAHAKALAAVSRITFTLAGVGALGGCIESPHTAGEPWADEVDASLSDGSQFDGALSDSSADAIDSIADEADAAPLDVAVDGMSDAIALDPEPEPDAAPDMLADAVVWSETTPCPSPQEDPEGWQACCQARGWGGDGDSNCAAWGPPMPPRMLA